MTDKEVRIRVINQLIVAINDELNLCDDYPFEKETIEVVKRNYRTAVFTAMKCVMSGKGPQLACIKKCSQCKTWVEYGKRCLFCKPKE